jgi:diaminohydroxyphosphoribosylaminopyrimidine deaminase / 5-amino-6-(5-phosphoribosylamino)uracil reductase
VVTVQSGVTGVSDVSGAETRVDPAESPRDHAFMERALFWAERGRGRTSPNPIVGAVVVSADGVVIGQGAHLVAGGPHAEIRALDEAGSRARGATLYCTLEPCCHVGRTGPCVERIVASGISRVVAATRDPNPRVAGRGFSFLREHAVSVDVGIDGVGARRQNEAFFTWVEKQRPFVIVKSAVSADGFVGRRDTRVKLTGVVADRWFQRQRAEIDAIAVGSKTLVVDDPLLTARDVYRHRPLTRVLFDWQLQISPSARVFSTLGDGPVLLIVSTEAAALRPARIDEMMRLGVGIEQFANRDVRAVLGRLAALGVLSLLVEGGPSLQSAFADAAVVDRIQRVVTPRVLRAGVAAAPFVIQAPEPARRLVLGDDVLIESDVYRPD